MDSLLYSIAEVIREKSHQCLKTFGVNSGKGGAALFYSNFAAYSQNTEFKTLAQDQVNELLLGLDPNTYRSDFISNYYHDLTEIGIVLPSILGNINLDFNLELLLVKIDLLLIDRLLYHIERKNISKLNGAVGIGEYFLTRLHKTHLAHEAITKLLDAIIHLKQGNEETGYYWTSYGVQEPRIYTGLNHGSAMIINFLSDLSHHEISPQTCKSLIYYAIKFLLRNTMDPRRYLSYFPIWIGNEVYTNNLCLAYGDLATVYGILRGSKEIDNSNYRDEAVKIGLSTINRVSVDSTFIKDASILYGASGTCMLYSALYRLTGEQSFKVSERYWLEAIPNFNSYDNKEYLNFKPQFYSNFSAANLSFGFGLIGIGLTLIQTLSNNKYSIKEFLGLK